MLQHLQTSPVASEETRRLGRTTLFLSAASFSIDTFNLTLKSSDMLPLDFPDDFPVSGALTLILGAYLLPLFVRGLTDFFRQRDDDIAQRLDHAQEIAETGNDQKDSHENVLFYPQMINLAQWFGYLIEFIVPLVIGLLVTWITADHVFEVFELTLSNGAASSSNED